MPNKRSGSPRDDVALRDIQVRAAWHYYIENLTQERIARVMAISRAKVVRLLHAAREAGIVQIQVGAKSGERIALERRLVERFGLSEAVVAPSPADDEQVAGVVGCAAATYLVEQMRDGISIGVGWGKTLDQCAHALGTRRFERVSVISLLGGMTHSRGVNPSAVARRMADAFGANCYQLTAPLLVANEALRAALWAEPALSDLRKRARRADLALVSVGDMSEQATLFYERLLPRADLATLLDARAVGDLLGHFLDADGSPVDHPVQHRVVALDLDDLRRVPRVVIASGGQRKIDILAAALNAVRASVLITDERAARGLLARRASVAATRSPQSRGTRLPRADGAQRQGGPPMSPPLSRLKEGSAPPRGEGAQRQGGPPMSAAGPLPRRLLPLGGTARSAKGVHQSAAQAPVEIASGPPEPMVRAAWLYYAESLTQAQISRLMRISRASVIGLLAAARDSGLVRIRIDAKSSAQRTLERRLVERFSLDEAVVVPAPASDADVARVVGHAAGTYLVDQLRDGMSIGVGWGETLHLSLKAIGDQPFKRVSVISLLGGITHSRTVTPAIVARRLADAFAADCYQLTAPLVVANPKIARALWAEPGLRALRDRARQADLVLASVGDVSANATLFRERLLDRADLAGLRQAGAVGDLLCHFLDADGRVVDHPLMQRIITVGLGDVRRVAKIVVASGGHRKVAALRAAMKGVPVRVLITDETAALGLLDGRLPR